MPELSMMPFVPSDVCLKCDGCCRYKSADSPWRPKLGEADKQSLAAAITDGDVLDDQAYIKTIQNCGQHFCRFLNQSDNTCGIYAKRPLECLLYPFVLSQTPDGIKVYVHLSCPYVQDHLSRSDFDSYVSYLKEFFRKEGVRAFLSRNRAMFHDYSAFAPELLHLFDLLFLWPLPDNEN
ncbi:MAG: YkgJ family cysteine cluster protein [Candidatus Omnitrophica bacterium]|nr:YkgJ family cysteine cluster protein [Candidatus Omnitrophota bacterium]MDE2009915.1 YkgJ family cysteine cluster protein [Candidatus Omnitrophota bacterium]MDE2215003.1 YkgJ family cysteine cluster protein [Candidatus Omnitrophota bacterium]MDE2232120.1 YkgJ family cysteine cluster protein [Candidatus Omnitrophota bacterium]